MSEIIDFTPLTAADHEPIARFLHRALVHWYESRLGQGARFGDSHEPFTLFPDVYEALDPGECVTARTNSGEMVPPEAGKPFQILLPAVNTDGNESSGIVLPEVAVPLGTYTGWNLRSPQVGAETMLSPLDGMFIPFAKTKSDRERTGDQRLSLEERYPTHEKYLERLEEAAMKLQVEGFLLEEDVTRIIKRRPAK